MNEKLLQFIWQHQYFNTQSLISTNNEQIKIINKGNYNTNQGPDFINATIVINEVKLIGNIELHVQASDFLKHNHQQDANYNNLVLHVVWENNLSQTVLPNIPTLELQDKVASTLLQHYSTLMENSNHLPCSHFLPALSEIGWLAWKESLLAARLTKKANEVLNTFYNAKSNWEETFWQLLAYNFGLKLNADLFKTIAKHVSNTTLSKHKNNLIQIEALLLGQANLLNNISDESYPKMLQKEYLFLKKKHQLVDIEIQPMFLRMRPANFPTIRLAQLASLIQQSNHLFSYIKEIETIEQLKKMLHGTANDYWHYHYTLQDEASPKLKPKILGESMVYNLIINTIAPVLFAYGNYTKEDNYKEKAIHFLQQIPSENNSIITNWKNEKIEAKNALDSQALIELFKNYCTPKKCLDCAVGNKIMRTK